jgi:UDP-glucose 4-epimerase
MKGNVIVTGGFGFIGTHIVDAICESSQHRIFVYDVNGKNTANAHGNRRNVTEIQGDIFDSDRLLKTMQEGEVSGVIHMVGLAHIPSCKQNPDLSYKLNVASVETVLEAMRSSGAERLIFPSTAAIYGVTNGPKVKEEAEPKPSTTYGSHKLAAEKLILEYSEKYGFKPTILRLFNVYGDLDKEQGVISILIRKALSGENLIIKGGDQLRDFVFLDDVVEVFKRSYDQTTSSGKIINVGSGIGLSIKDIALMVRHSFPNAEVSYEPATQEEYSIYADTSRMKSTLGFSGLDPRKGIPEFVEKCKSNNEKVNLTQ